MLVSPMDRSWQTAEAHACGNKFRNVGHALCGQQELRGPHLQESRRMAAAASFVGSLLADVDDFPLRVMQAWGPGIEAGV